MEFNFTPEESQSLASALIKFYKKKGFQVGIEKPFSEEAPYRTTLVVKKTSQVLLIEAQSKFKYEESLKALAHWLAARQESCELYISVRIDGEIALSKIEEIRKDGVGLIYVSEEGEPTKHLKAKNFALIVNPSPLANCGRFNAPVKKSIEKFNGQDRKDGIRDLCECFEESVESLGIKLVKKGFFDSVTEEVFRKKDLANQINILAAKAAYREGKQPFVSSSLQTDLHSFREARNLVDHKATGLQKKKRERQYKEKMLMGIRLISDLEAIKRRIK